MTRAEMENIWMGFCKVQDSCRDCPLDGHKDQCNWNELPDEELEKVVEFILENVKGEDSAPAERIDVEPQQTDSGAVMVNRDLLNMIKGELLMLAACDGAQITLGMSNEMMCIVENIDKMLKGVEG